MTKKKSFAYRCAVAGALVNTQLLWEATGTRNVVPRCTEVVGTRPTFSPLTFDRSRSPKARGRADFLKTFLRKRQIISLRVGLQVQEHSSKSLFWAKCSHL